MLAAVRATTASAAATCSRAGRVVRDLGQHLAAPLAADLGQEDVAVVVEQLGQRDVEAGVGLRAGVHRDAEAGAAGLAAIDGDDEGAVAPGLVVRVDIGPAEEDPVLDARSRGARRSARR